MITQNLPVWEKHHSGTARWSRGEKQKHQSDRHQIMNNWRLFFLTVAFKCVILEELLKWKKTPLCVLIIERVCDCLSGSGTKRRARRSLHHLGRTANATASEAALVCARGSDISLLQHVQKSVKNIASLWSHMSRRQGCMQSSSLQWHTSS